MAYNKNLNISPNNVVNISGSLITLTGSLSGAQVSGTMAQFTFVSASVVSASSYIGIPTSPISIGDTITGGTANSILFVNPAATIAEDNPSFTYDTATNNISLTSDAGMSYKASDLGDIINSYNTSAGSANQFFINHNLSNVELGNLRGNTIITSGNLGINVNATQAAYAKFITRSSAGLIALTENAGLSSVIAWDDSGSSNTLRLAGSPLILTGDGGVGAEHVRVTSAGNVGIGTSSPTQKLHVAGETLIDGGGSLRLQSVTPGTDGILKFIEPAGTVRSSIYYASTDLLRIAAGGTDRLVIDSTGDVGIGTSSPTQKLHVQGAIAISGDETADNAKIHFQASDYSNRFTIKTDLDASTLSDQLTFRSVSVDNILTLKGNGNVGIGTTVPNFTLAVTGTLGVSGNTTLSTISGTTAQFTALTASAITSSGTITCLSLVETSTRRIKKDIYSMQSQIENIKKLNPVNYVRILDNKQEFGFIAEELKEVYPEFVIGDGVNYPKMVSVLVSAVQELTQKIEKQQDEIELLKNKKKTTRGKK